MTALPRNHTCVQPSGGIVSTPLDAEGLGCRVAAVLTLGVPRGWRTSRGVSLGDPADKVLSVYGTLPWSRCVGYGAVSIRRGGAVASIYTYGESVYGFALTLPSEPVCQ